MDLVARKTKGTHRFVWTIVILAVLSLVAATSASAQCSSDPTKHFRGGLWKHWILQLAPGPTAQAAVQRIIAEVNQARTQAQLPLLVFDPQEPIQVAVFEENNPRGPDGKNLVNRLPNQEVLLSTFAELEGALDGEVALILTDPLRSNAELTAKGVPGVAAVFERTMKFALEGSDSEVSTKWVASNEVDEIKFSAEYSSAAITARARFPGTSTYLNCNLGHLLDLMFRSLPTQTFKFLDRFQANVLSDLTREDVKVSLEVKHHDPDIDAIFNDQENRLLRLFEFDRVVRFERQ